MPQINPLFLSFALTYLALFGVLFLMYSKEMPQPSFEALLQPYIGGKSTVSIIFALITIPELFICFYMFGQLSKNPANHMTVLVFPEVIALFGFIIGILNHNPWASMPYIALGFAVYAFFLSRLMSQEPHQA
jgi:hypothetical protein